MIVDYVLLVIAYLLGSISSAVLVCKAMSLPDPRTQGSGNPGATNVLRIGGKKAAAITLLADFLKGFLPTLAAFFLASEPLYLALTGLAAFFGHLFPIFFGFKGGKGVATALGVQFAWNWLLGAIVAAIWLFFAKVVKISSLSALVSMALAPVILWLISQDLALTLTQTLMSLLLIARHKSNIQRLIRGEEGGIGTSKVGE